MKTTLKTAASQKRNLHDNSCVHITTLDFGKLRPTYCLNVRRGDNIFLDYSQFTRLSPLAAPTFGSAKIKSYAFWVPMRIIWTGYHNFRINNVDSSLPTSKPNAKLGEFFEGILTVEGTHNNFTYFVTSLSDTQFPKLSTGQARFGSWNAKVVASVDAQIVAESDISTFESSHSAYDQIFYFNSGTTFRCIAINYSAFGKEVLNILMSLGYPFPRVVFSSYTAGETTLISPVLNDPVSILPLVAFFRALYDKVYPSQYVQQLGLGWLFENYNFDATGYPGDVQSNVSLWIMDALNLLFTPYEQDFFNSLWLTPNAVAAGSSSSQVSAVTPLLPPDGLDTGALGVRTNQNASGVRSTSTLGYTLTNAALQWLQATSDFCLRNNIGGVRFEEFMKAHTGWSSSMDSINCTQFVKSWVDDVNMMDVTQTSQSTDTSLLGEQAGKGVSSGSGKLRFEAKEDGFLLVLTMVVPVTAYYQGIAPYCEALTDRRQLYTEEFDSVGMEPVSLGTIFYDSQTLSQASAFNPQSVFGHCTRYANRYKHRQDRLTGMFRFASQNVGLDSYHTFRNVMYGRSSLPANDAQFKLVDNQFDRIFATTPTSADSDIYQRFLTIFNFEVTRKNTMRSISASMPMFERGGEAASVDYQGTQI